MRKIERRIENEPDEQKRKILKELTDLPRLWIRKNNSHHFKLTGTKLFHDIQEEVNTIIGMRDIKEHPILKDLEILLRTAIEDYPDICSDIKKAENWIFDINDILLGKADKKGNRNTEQYKKRTTAKKIKKRLFKYIINLEKKKRMHSDFSKEIIKHIGKTYNNWKRYLFACYDVHELPNTNNELELSHSRLKRTHRRMTGKKNANQFLLLHGEQASYCFELDYSAEELIKIFRNLDYKKIEKRKREEKCKSKKRGDQIKIQKNVHEKPESVQQSWANTNCF